MDSGFGQPNWLSFTLKFVGWIDEACAIGFELFLDRWRAWMMFKQSKMSEIHRRRAFVGEKGRSQSMSTTEHIFSTGALELCSARKKQHYHHLPITVSSKCHVASIDLLVDGVNEEAWRVSRKVAAW